MNRLEGGAASSAAWGWLFPTIPKAYGFEAATQLRIKVHKFQCTKYWADEDRLQMNEKLYYHIIDQIWS